MASKNGRMKIKCQNYRNLGRRQINKDLKAKKHLARIEHFAKRKEEGKAYEYKPPKNKKERRERAKKNVDRRVPIAELDSWYRKLDNELAKEKLAKKEKDFKRTNKSA